MGLSVYITLGRVSVDSRMDLSRCVLKTFHALFEELDQKKIKLCTINFTFIYLRLFFT